MLKLSKKVEYALISMIHMDESRSGDLSTAREISDRYAVPGELLGKVLQALAKAGLVDSVHGARGGYRLIRPLDRVTLGEVVEAVDGPVHIACCQDNPESCGQFSTCNIKKPVQEVQRQLVGYMYSLPLSSFRDSVTADGIAVDAESRGS